MSVDLDPQELGFQRPFDHEVNETLRIHNPNKDPVAFKVKTTAPKQYCVRPNSGRIESGSTVEVQVLLQAMKEDPPTDARCRDKFLVQSIAISALHEHSSIQQVWQSIETTAKSSIQEKKIRVVFLPVGGAAPTNGASHVDDSSFRESPTPAPQTPARSSQMPPPAAVGAVSLPESKPEGAKNTGEIRSEASNPAAEKSGIAAVAAAVSNAVPTTGEVLKAQLAEAKATIVRLLSQAQESGLRQRKTETSNKDATERVTTGLGVQHAPAGGVPVQIVAGLCLLCFLVAYFFF